MSKPKRVKTSSSNYKPHYVDENTETVYVAVDSWGAAQAAPHWVKRHYPGYKCVNTSAEGLTKIMKQDETDD